jgi:hypothetical protein
MSLLLMLPAGPDERAAEEMLLERQLLEQELLDSTPPAHTGSGGAAGEGCAHYRYLGLEVWFALPFVMLSAFVASGASGLSCTTAAKATAVQGAALVLQSDHPAQFHAHLASLHLCYTCAPLLAR